MVIRCGRVAALLIVSWLDLQIARTQADDNYIDSRGTMPTAAQPGLQSWPAPFRMDADPVAKPEYVAHDASWLEPIQLPIFDLPVPDSRPSSSAAPPTSSSDDTVRDDGRFFTINVSGQQLRIVKPLPESTQDSTPDKKLANAGTVRGRLLQNGSPVANCYVVIVPWPKGDKTDPSVDTCEPLSAITDGDGRYFFEHVPSGEYKLTWLPNGTHEWIRRIAMRPDVIVHEGQDLTLKDIRMAMRTIN